MLIVLVLLILALLAKDATPLGDRYILRAFSEGMAFLAGCGWLATSGFRGVTWRHAVIALYVTVLTLGMLQAASPLYVGLQILALAAIVLFSLAFLDASNRDHRMTLYAARTMLVALTVVCLASLLVKFVQPGYVYEQTFEGPRFRGLFSKPAMMGAASGLLLGLSLFVPWSWGVKAVALTASVPCLLLTGSRTFWAAAVVGIGVTAFRQARRRWAYAPIAAVLIVAVVCAGIAASGRYSPQKEGKFLRQDSIDTLSGRTSMWAQALQRYKEHPWLGYGFTTGGQVLDEEGKRRTVAAAPRSISQGSITLHNGYVQALLDSGGIGAVLYVGVIASALLCFLLYDSGGRHTAEFYSLLFLAVANLGETVIFGAGVLHGVWYWYVTVLALTLPSINPRLTPSHRSNSAAVEPVPHESNESVHALPPPRSRRFALVASPKGWS